MGKRTGIILITLSFLFSCVFTSLSWSHSGRTDSSGGHYNRKTGEYHYHSKPAPRPSRTSPSRSQERETTKSNIEKCICEGVLIFTDSGCPCEPAEENTKKKQGIVYITKTGKRFHSEGCRYLRRSKIPIDVKKALDVGYTACKVCKGIPTKAKKE